jgi:pantothenate kinase type III
MGSLNLSKVLPLLFMKFGNSRIAWKCGRKRGEFDRAKLIEGITNLIRAKISQEWRIVSVLESEEKKIGRLLMRHRISFRFIRIQDVPMRFAYRKSLGMDRALNCFAVARLQLAPAVVIDMGSAITVDFVDAQQRHRGGWILPGPKLQLEALSEKTDQLPSLSWKLSRQWCGTSTKGCLQVGLTQELRALLHSARQVAETNLRPQGVGPRVSVILTGGWSRDFRGVGTEYRKDLALEGLSLLEGLGRDQNSLEASRVDIGISAKRSTSFLRRARPRNKKIHSTK